jgi:hypothetical protein
MGNIFTRPLDETDKLEKSLEESLAFWEKSIDEYKRALAINLRCDYRISERRANNFKIVFGKWLSNLDDALLNYQKIYVNGEKNPNNPDFCHAENLIFDCSTGHCCIGFDPKEELVTVMCLNALRTILKDADNKLPKRILPNWDELKNLGISEALPVDSSFNQWLDNQFTESSGKTKSGNSIEVKKIIAAFFELLEYDLTKRPDYYKFPVWVTKWSLYQKVAFISRSGGVLDIDRLNQVVGVNRKWDSWQIVVKYPTNAVKSLYRPSQLDGGYYPHHFPPPPLQPDSAFCFADGGHTVDLASLNLDLLPEFIHQPIPLKLEYYQGIIGKTTLKDYKVSKPRETHYQNLSNIYYPHKPDEIKKWMAKAI